MSIEDDDHRATDPAPPLDEETNPGLAPPPISAEGMRRLNPWVPIPGAPEWAQEMDRRNHEERQLLMADNEMVRREIRQMGKRVTIHDERLDGHDEQIGRLKRRVAELQAENAELRGRLDPRG